MKVKISDITEPAFDDNLLYLSQRTKDYLIEGKMHWPVILRGLKRVLRARVSSHQKDDLIKLQGKLELIAELENFFLFKE